MKNCKEYKIRTAVFEIDLLKEKPYRVRFIFEDWFEEFIGEDCIKEFLKEIMRKKYNGIFIFPLKDHNNTGEILLKFLLKHNYNVSIGKGEFGSFFLRLYHRYNIITFISKGFYYFSKQRR